MNPISLALQQFPVLILDGAFATELESRGCDLNDPLWSAKVLMEQPELIHDVHFEYFNRGADFAITASYQASYEGFMARGLSEKAAEDLLKQSVSLAKSARDGFWANPFNRINRPKPMVAASIGPYGAFLANGSEYTGDYQLDQEGLRAFHAKRLKTLVDAGPDLLACETLPRLSEAKALVSLLEEHPGTYAWISFTARNGTEIASGEAMRDCAAYLDGIEQVAAIGINCTAPEYVASLIAEVRAVSDKPIVVYPNSGETYDAVTKTWHQEGHCCANPFAELSKTWLASGATLIGGCCRTTPADIEALKVWLREEQPRVYPFGQTSAPTFENIVTEPDHLINHVIIEPGKVFPKHPTDAYVYAIVVKGVLSVSLGNSQSKQYPSGCLVAIPKGVPSELGNLSEEIVELFVIKYGTQA